MKYSNKAFTLIELLVVITIIGILAGFAVPAITGGLDKAKQAGDINNIRNVGLLLFSDANDNNGNYRSGATTKAVFETLLNSGALTEGKILSSNAFTCSISGTIPNKTITAGTFAWGYAGLDGSLNTSSDDRYVLLCSQGYDATVVNVATVALKSTAKSWGTKGLTVYTKGNSAKFNGSGKGTDSTGATVAAGSAAFGGGDTGVTPTATIKDQ